MMNYQARLKNARQEMSKRGIGMMFLTFGANLWYLAGFTRKQPDQTDINAYGDYVCGACIGAEGEFVVLAPRMGGAFWQREAENKPWVDEVRTISENERPRDFFAEAVKRFDLRGKGIALDDRAWIRTGLEFQHVLPDSRISPASDIIAPMRMIKDADEVAAMQKAARITDKAYGEVIRSLKIGMTEYDVAHEVDYQFTKQGAAFPSFVTGVTFTRPGQGKVIGLPRSTGNVLKEGDAIAFDIGACYNGYCSDFGRNVFVGKPPAEFRRIHGVVIEAQAAAIEAMVSGKITAAKLDHVARSLIEKQGYSEAFTHRLGHGIGVTVHEPPFLYPPDETTLMSGMTFTIEPSICLRDNYSCRVEDVVMVTEKRGLPFNEFQRELTVI